MPGKDFKVFLPDEDDIYSNRAPTLRWLRRMGFEDDLIAAVMVYECPNVKIVRALVVKLGPEEAKKRLRELM